jgi:hypothetical protein
VPDFLETFVFDEEISDRFVDKLDCWLLRFGDLYEPFRGTSDRPGMPVKIVTGAGACDIGDIAIGQIFQRQP